MRRPAAGVAAAVVLSACAPLPPAPTGTTTAPPTVAAPPAAGATARGAAIAQHERLARAAREAGDLRAAADHYGVLVLIDGANPAHREALRATQAAIDAAVQERLRAAAAARRAGDTAKARDAWLRVIALEPANAEAARALRELEQQAMARTQADRAARARAMDGIVANARARAATESAADLEQTLELVRSSDASIALREARAWMETNADDRPGRQRLASALADRARDLDAKAQLEWALALYDQAARVGGAEQAEAAKRAAALRRALADAAYADGMRVRGSNLTAAIRHYETALRYDPQHALAKERLREARAAQRKLERIAK